VKNDFLKDRNFHLLPSPSIFLSLSSVMEHPIPFITLSEESLKQRKEGKDDPRRKFVLHDEACKIIEGIKQPKIAVRKKPPFHPIFPFSALFFIPFFLSQSHFFFHSFFHSFFFSNRS